MRRVGILTVSDRGAAGEYEDRSGPLAAERVAAATGWAIERRAVIERDAPGIAEALRAESLKVTRHAMLSRAVAGLRGQTLIVNLPGNPKAVSENLDVLLPVLPHALDLLTGRPESGQEHRAV